MQGEQYRTWSVAEFLLESTLFTQACQNTTLSVNTVIYFSVLTFHDYKFS